MIHYYSLWYINTYTLHVNCSEMLLDISRVKNILLVEIFLSSISIIGGCSRLLGILSAIHVSELDESVNFNLRQLSSPDPMVEVNVIFTPGSGSSRQRYNMLLITTLIDIQYSSPFTDILCELML